MHILTMNEKKKLYTIKNIKGVMVLEKTAKLPEIPIAELRTTCINFNRKTMTKLISSATTVKYRREKFDCIIVNS